MKLDLASKVKAYREFNGLTMKEFGAKVGIGKSTVSDLENGACTPSKETIGRAI